MVPPPASEWLSARVLTLPWAEAAVTLIAFAAGATVGSFLNVVAYRVPRGESVARGGSRCPSCGTRIRPRDNVPVLGWLLLRGRCRDCGAPIAATYPAVEAGCGLLLATLAAVHLAGGVGPVAAGVAASAFDRCFMRGDVAPLGRWLHDAALMLVVVAWSLLAARGHRPTVATRSLIVAASAVSALTIAPPLGVQWDGGSWPTAPGPLARATAVIVGCAAGLAVDRLAVWTTVGGGATLIGTACGWQAVVAQVTLIGIIATFRRLSDPATPNGEHVDVPDPAKIREGIATWLAAAAFVILTRDVLRRG